MASTNDAPPRDRTPRQDGHAEARGHRYAEKPGLARTPSNRNDTQRLFNVSPSARHAKRPPYERQLQGKPPIRQRLRGTRTVARVPRHLKAGGEHDDEQSSRERRAERRVRGAVTSPALADLYNTHSSAQAPDEAPCEVNANDRVSLRTSGVHQARNRSGLPGVPRVRWPGRRRPSRCDRVAVRGARGGGFGDFDAAARHLRGQHRRARPGRGGEQRRHAGCAFEWPAGTRARCRPHAGRMEDVGAPVPSGRRAYRTVGRDDRGGDPITRRRSGDIRRRPSAPRRSVPPGPAARTTCASARRGERHAPS